MNESKPTVHLVHPPPYGEVPFKNLGLCSVAAGLRAAGFETRYHDISEQLHRSDQDFYHQLILRLSRRAGEMSDLPDLELLGEVLTPSWRESDLAATIRNQAQNAVQLLDGAQVVGVTFNTLTAYFAVAFGRLLRSKREDAPLVVMGGPLTRIAAMRELMLRLGAADAIVIGEGDVVTGPIIDALVSDGTTGLDGGEVSGVAWLDNDEVRVISPATLLEREKLDALPLPVLEGNVLDQFLPIAASRGCPRQCAYCSESGLWEATEGAGHSRRRAPEVVVEEMAQRIAQTGLRDFHFHDDLINGSRSWLESFVETITARKLDCTWESFFEPYRLDAKLLEAMRDSGCRLIKYGVQSFAPEVLRAMKRPRSLSQVIETLITTYGLGISTHFDMLIGHPGETDLDHQRNIEAISELYERTGERLYFSLNPFYLAAGSEIWRHPEKYGIEVVNADASSSPDPLSEALAAGPPYAVGYVGPLSRGTIMQRMEGLAEILRRYDKDYLYLGQDHLPVSPRGGRVLPRLDELPKLPADQSEGELRLTLNSTSNLKLSPSSRETNSQVHGPFEDLEELKTLLTRSPPDQVVRVVGGEPTLSRQLPQVLALCKGLRHKCVVETNGLRASSTHYVAALRRSGLTATLVHLLASTEPLMSDLSGVPDALETVLAGVRNLLEAGVDVELGLLVTASTLQEKPTIADLVATLGEVSRVRLIIAPLIGSDVPAQPDLEELELYRKELLNRARSLSISMTFEDRLRR